MAEAVGVLIARLNGHGKPLCVHRHPLLHSTCLFYVTRQSAGRVAHSAHLVLPCAFIFLSAYIRFRRERLRCELSNEHSQTTGVASIKHACTRKSVAQHDAAVVTRPRHCMGAVFSNADDYKLLRPMWFCQAVASIFDTVAFCVAKGAHVACHGHELIPRKQKREVQR